MEGIRQALAKSVETGFIDKSIDSDTVFRPVLLTNDPKNGKKVLTTILRELEGCDEFWFSVAFITTSGVAMLKLVLAELEKSGVKGKILTSTYLQFTHPEALRCLKKFKNIQLKIATKIDFHSKGYLFGKGELNNLIIGSSNWTQTALTVNKEWNLKVSATKNSELIQSVRSEFKSVFDNATVVSDKFIESYALDYNKRKEVNEILNANSLLGSKSDIQPNQMQREALENINILRKEGKKKALLISATGTGKTYLSAFDVRNVKPKKFLFVVHRNTIAKKAMDSFNNILDIDITMGLYSSHDKDFEADYIFSTIQTISRTEHLEKFDRKHFDYIVIDETHRAGADSYKRLMEYFEPKFLLGMTATPERTDGADIMSLFDHNIAYEIRLHRALEERMLAPFHYYGVTDLSVNDEEISELSDFNMLTAKERVDRIIEKVEFYGTDSGIPKGLIFCSRKEECAKLSDEFNSRNYKTLSLTGDNKNEQRKNAIERLESDGEDRLDYIFTVDIFNEGIDIPKCNQIIMLRPTQSAIIFVQQLGRGLRKENGKDYLTVIDFIGNYSNNYMVPIALFGDTTYNKDTIRQLMTGGSRLMPGTSTINFEKIAKERIYSAIDKAKLNRKKDLRKDYDLLKFKLGRIPMMVDFFKYGSRDPHMYVESFSSYYNLVEGQENEIEKLNSDLKLYLELFACEIYNAKRVEECFIMSSLLIKPAIKIVELNKIFIEKYGYNLDDKIIESSIDNLNFKFVTKKSGGQLVPVGDLYNIDIVRLDSGVVRLSDSFSEVLKNQTFRLFFEDNLISSMNKFDTKYSSSKFYEGFILYEKYSRKDVFRILNWKGNPVAQNVGGYMISKDESNCPIFVNYHKSDEISDTTKYEDKFLSSREFQWMSKSKRKLSSKDVVTIARGELRLPLFVKKSNDEGLDFYYMGDVSPIKDKTRQTFLKNKNGMKVSVVQFLFEMQTPVSDEMMEYLIERH